MESGKSRLLAAARTLLAERPTQEPSTREIYEAAGVAAPTLYHHFGTKEGLLDAVAEQAFDAYLERKRTLPRTGDLITDFAAGWDMHVGFGVDNPTLYALMYRPGTPGRTAAAETAEAELRVAVQRMADAGLLRVSVDEAVALTTAMAVGCVTQLVREGGGATSPLAARMRATLLAELAGTAAGAAERSGDASPATDATQVILQRLDTASDLFTPAEDALLRQWLRTLSEPTDHHDQEENVTNTPPLRGRKTP